VVGINKSISKYMAKRWSSMVSFIKVITLYPIDTVREKTAEFKSSTMILSLILGCYLVAVSAGYYKVALSEYIVGWEGKISYVEVKNEKTAQGEVANTVIGVEKSGDKKEIVQYVMGAQQAASMKKDMPVRKPFFYSETLFDKEGASFSVVLSDFLFLIMGILIYLFALICGSSFITIIFSSVFMVRSKYAKNKK